MINFIIFGFVTLILIVFAADLKRRYGIASFYAYFGLALMLIGSVLQIFELKNLLYYLSPVLMAFGFLFFALSLFSAIDKLKSKQTDRSAELQAKVVSDILQVAATRESLIDLLNYSLDRLLELFSLNSGAIHIFHKPRNMLVMGSYRGLTPARAKKLEQLTPGQTAIGRAVEIKQVFIIRDLSVSPDYKFFGSKMEGYSFLAVAPIMVDDECWGVISLLGRRKYHPGLVNIDQLEQLSAKLGQALILGRENRRMAAAFNKSKQKIAFFETVMDVVRNHWHERRFNALSMLEQYPEKLFGDRQYIVLMSTDTNYVSEYVSGNITGMRMTRISIPREKIDDSLKFGRFFKLDIDDISNYVDDPAFASKKPVGYGFSFDHVHTGLVIIDETKVTDLQVYENDIRLIENLLNLNHLNKVYLFTREEKPHIATPEPAGGKIEVGKPAATDSVSGNVKEIIESINNHNLNLDRDELIKQLGRLDKTLSEKTDLPIKPESFSPNSVIQDLISEEELNVAFYPGIDIPELKTDADRFRQVVKDVIDKAIFENRRIRLKSSSENGSIKLIIEGDLKPGFPEQELINRAAELNLDLIFPDKSGRLRVEDGPELKDVPEKLSHNILVAETSEIVLNLLRDFFDRLEFNYDICSDSIKAMTMLESAMTGDQPYDIAVIDMSFENISGLEMARRIKQKYASIYIIIVASWGMNLNTHTLADAGVNAVLHKPFRYEQLQKVLPDTVTDASADQ